MATTAAQVCNLALGRIGVRQTIESLDDATPEAAACAAAYDITRQAMLAGAPWPFATRRAALAQLAGVTRTGWAYCYALPGDCLAPQHLWPGTRNPRLDQRIPFAVEADDSGENSMVLADVTSPELVYTSDVSSVGRFSPFFVDALGWALAVELSMSLAIKPELATRAAQMAQARLERAKAAAFMEGQPDLPAEAETIAVRSGPAASGGFSGVDGFWHPYGWP